MKRLSYIDWMRGLACVLMFQTHCYDSWLSPEARKSAVFTWSQLGGTLPAPLFVLLSGISFALVTERLREKGATSGEMAKTTIRRGAEIFGLGLLFRIQEYVLGYGYSPWTDLLRVDVLNILGLSMMLMGVLCWLSARRASDDVSALSQNVAASRTRGILAGLLAATLIAMVTPLLWTTHRPRALPWPIESYINGVHIYGNPQPWLFPLFPWAAFAFAGLAIGFLILAPWSVRNQLPTVAACGVAGAALYALGQWLDAQPRQIYAVYDFWHTSPEFFLMRLGILLMIILASYMWCRWGAGQWGFNPLIELGQASLLVYWVHIEFVYGRVSILPKHAEGILGASAGLLAIFLAMLALASIRTHAKDWMKPRPAEQVLASGHRPLA